MEVVMKSKEVISLLRAFKLFGGCGNNNNNKIGTIDRAEGQHFP